MKSVLIAALLVGFVVGCGKETTKSTEKHPVVNEDVLVSVDGKDYTKAMLEEELAINRKLMRVVNPNTSMDKISRREAQVRSIANERFIEREVLLAEARHRGLSVSEAEFADIKQRFVKTLAGRAGKLTYDDVLAKLTPEEGKSLTETLKGDMLFQKIHTVLSDETKVTTASADADRIYGNYLKYRESAKAQEAQIFRQATNIWKRVVAGDDFAEIGSAVANAHIKFEADWGTFDLEELKGDVALCKALVNMSAGDVTPPVLADNGLVIVKLLDVVKPSFEEGSVHPQYHLSSIFFELPEALDEVSERKAFMAKFDEEMSLRALKARIEELRAQHKIVRADKKGRK